MINIYRTLFERKTQWTIVRKSCLNLALFCVRGATAWVRGERPKPQPPSDHAIMYIPILKCRRYVRVIPSDENENNATRIFIFDAHALILFFGCDSLILRCLSARSRLHANSRTEQNY